MNQHLARKLTLLGLALLPALGVVTARWVAPGTSPRSASAAQPEASVPDLSLPALAVINPDSELPKAIQLAGSQAPISSPLAYFNDQPRIENTTPVQTVEQDPTFTLTSIVKSRENMAVVNGKLRRIGDEVMPGWKALSIDPPAGVVELSRGQRTIKLQLRNAIEPR